MVESVLQMVPEVDQLTEDDHKVLLRTSVVIADSYTLASRLISGPLVSQLWR